MSGDRTTASRPLNLALVLTCLCLGLGVSSAHSKTRPAVGQPQLAASAPTVREIEATPRVVDAGGIHKEYGEESGVLRRYFRRVPGVGFKAAGTPRQVADAFLAANASELGIDAARLASTLRLASEKSTPSGVHLRYDQVVGEIPVYRGEIVVKIARTGEVSSVHNNLRITAPSAVGKPGIPADVALERGVGAVRPRGRAIGEFTAELYMVEFEAGMKPAYLVSVPVEDPMGDWLVYVDAQTGAVLGIEDRMVYATGSGRVFDPDPLAPSGNQTLPDNGDLDTGIPFPAAYNSRTLMDILDMAGTFKLEGPYCRIQEIESPVIAPVTAAHPDSFFFLRSAPAFEDVNVYFHIDQSQRYIQSLGFNNVNNRVQPCDPHGLNGDDNSHYVISTRILAWGEGGVDDAEDADVILHEYGHAIQHDVVPGWGGGQEGAMGEGFGDYWAGSYSYALYPAFQPTFVFNWDGHNVFWPGRLLIDPALHYPENCCGGVHASGTLWCSGLTDAMRQVGRATMDALVLDHHFALGTTATMADAANQIIQSDIDLNGGANLQTIVAVFDFWGFVDASTFIPTITHAPLGDTEDETGPYPVVATITSAQPLDPSSLLVVYGVGSFTDSLTMTPTANPNEFSADIPGPLSNVTVQYYVTASDSGGGTATHPAGAPGMFHTFFVGADTEPPVIVHAPASDFPLLNWPASLNATITDNLGVDDASVQVSWAKNGVAETPFALTRVGMSDVFAGTFNNPVAAVGDTIAYDIVALDEATIPNMARSPVTGEHEFVIIAALGVVLVLDDDEVAKGPSFKEVAVPGRKGDTQLVASARDAGDVGLSAATMAQVLIDAGYVVTVESAATSNPAAWSSYGLLVSSSGGNEAPVANAAYRAALEAYVAGGGKLLVEGGEVVYDCASSPGYPTFAANVLHSTDWDDDNAGALNLLAAQSLHPIALMPNTLPATLTINYTAFGSEDSFKPLAPAVIVYGVTAQVGNGGILVYDPTPSPQSGQIVVFGFDYKDLAQAGAAADLLENTAAYLLRPEGAATGSVSGRVTLAGETDHSGVTVTVVPGNIQVMTVVAPNGSYSVPNLYGAAYRLTASKPGFQTVVQFPVGVAEGNNTGGVNFVLFPQPSAEVCESPGTAIPDNNPVGIQRNLTVTDVFPITAVQVDINLTHTYIGDLIVELRRGAQAVRLHNRTGGTAENIVGTYPTTLAVNGPGALANFFGQASNGTWTLFVSDNAAADLGTVNSWCLRLTGQADSSVTTDVLFDEVRVASLLPTQPNPAPRGLTTFSFALPSRQHVGLYIYDVAGRLVRTLVDRQVPPGYHAERWDGLDDGRRAVAAGVYFYRLESQGAVATRKVVVVR